MNESIPFVWVSLFFLMDNLLLVCGPRRYMHLLKFEIGFLYANVYPIYLINIYI